MCDSKYVNKKETARVQLVISDEDRERFRYQARREGMSLSAWLRAAAHDRLEQNQSRKTFQSVADLEEFFRECTAREASTPEPDWEEHLRVINDSRRRGTPDI